MSIDWEQLARDSGGLGDEGFERGGTAIAEAALELLGREPSAEEFDAGIEHYLAARPGSELVYSLLRHLRPPAAAQACYAIYRSSDRSDDNRCCAVELLRGAASAAHLPWVAEFLEDPHPEIQLWGASLLDQLLWKGMVLPAAATLYLAQARAHPNRQVRYQAAKIRGYLASRARHEGTQEDG